MQSRYHAFFFRSIRSSFGVVAAGDVGRGGEALDAIHSPVLGTAGGVVPGASVPIGNPRGAGGVL
eukprot:scaffold204313_cov33-Prasinocladus_malaysianus.AAC.1